MEKKASNNYEKLPFSSKSDECFRGGEKTKRINEVKISKEKCLSNRVIEKIDARLVIIHPIYFQNSRI